MQSPQTPYTKLKDTNRQALRDIIPLAKPFTLVVEPGALCNFRCAMCFQSAAGNAYFNGNKRNMPMETFARVVRQLADWEGGKLKVLKLSLYGEPLLNPEFCAMLRMAKEAGIAERIETTTNASLLTPEISEGLVDGGLDYMRVSIYAATQARHEAVTGSAIPIETIHGNLAALQAVKARRGAKSPFVAVKMLDTYGPENEAFRALYQDVADEIYIDKPHNWVATGEKSFVDALYGAGNENVAADFRSQENHCRACGVSFYTLAVRNNGDVAPCCVDWSGGTNVGNVHDTPLKEIWQGEAMRAFWARQLLGRNHENASCGRCDVYKSAYYARDNVDGVPVERLRQRAAD